MSAYSFALAGSGWRAAFYARLAGKMPELFRLTDTWVHTPEKAPAWQARYGGGIVDQVAELCRNHPDFVVVAIGKQHSFPFIMAMLDTDIPLLLETPPGVRLGQLYALWEKAEKRRAPVLVAEQYPDHPFFASWGQAVAQGMIGPVSNLSISAVHGYHAVALMRLFLGVKGENARIVGSQYHFPVRQTGSREGPICQGEVRMPSRNRAAFHFDSGRTAFYDFSAEQYHSAIRFSHWSVQGETGEISDDSALCLDGQGNPLQVRLTRHQTGQRGCGEYGLLGITAGERWLYRNPYPGYPLSDDEIALAGCMERMGRIARGEAEFTQGYPLAEALQDTYLAALMRNAIDTRQEVSSRDAPWKRALR